MVKLSLLKSAMLSANTLELAHLWLWMKLTDVENTKIYSIHTQRAPSVFFLKLYSAGQNKNKNPLSKDNTTEWLNKKIAKMFQWNWNETTL